MRARERRGRLRGSGKGRDWEGEDLEGYGERTRSSRKVERKEMDSLVDVKL